MFDDDSSVFNVTLHVKRADEKNVKVAGYVIGDKPVLHSINSSTFPNGLLLAGHLMLCCVKISDRFSSLIPIFGK